MNRLSLVTCRVLPEPDPDQELLLAALADAGHPADLLAWDDPAADPSRYDLCVLRSCWDYHHDPAAFVAWLDRASSSTRLYNCEAVVRWNLHKRYLDELAGAGVPVIPTVFFSRGAGADLAAVMDEHGWDEVVVKPSVSAASFRTRRFARDDAGAGQAFLDDLLADRDAMVQVCVPGFDTTGERALVWIDGGFTHAVRKEPRYDGDDERVSDALPVSDAERALGDRVIATVRDELLYARVDVIEHGGETLVSEFELIEPSLFLMQSPGALGRFVRAIVRIATRAG